MFYIKVQTDSDYKFIREDRWLTPCRCPVLDDAKVFMNTENAVDFINKFNLVQSGWVHEICDFHGTVHTICSLKNNGNGQFVVDVQKMK